MLFDLIGAVLSLLSTYYFIRLNNKAWFIGMIATGVNGLLYWQKGIYADMGLEIIYFLSMCYGLYLWKDLGSQNIDKQNTSIQSLTLNHGLFLTLVFGLIFGIIYGLLLNFTQSTVAFMDAFTASISLVAQWLMCHKFIATWVLWLVTDVLYSFMYLGKNLPFHCLLMIIYAGMAVTGYIVWARRSKAALTDSISINPHFSNQKLV